MPVSENHLKMSALLGAALELPGSSSEINRENNNGNKSAIVPRIIGTGLHTGKKYAVRFDSKKPEVTRNEDEAFHASLNLFELAFDNDFFKTPAYWSRLSGTSRATALVLRSEKQKRRLELKTVEHLLAATSVCGASSLAIHIELCDQSDLLDSENNKNDIKNSSAFELPVFDGSSKLWLEYLREFLPSHVCQAPRFAWRVKEDFEVKDKERVVRVKGRKDFKSSWKSIVSFGSHWRQQAEYVWDYHNIKASIEDFAQNIAPARTFGFQNEIEDLRKRGLIKGGSLENAVLIDGHRVINSDGLRLENELAAHKLLDGLGDFALLGAPIFADVSLEYAGHDMHLRAVEEGVRKGYLERVTL